MVAKSTMIAGSNRSNGVLTRKDFIGHAKSSALRRRGARPGGFTGGGAFGSAVVVMHGSSEFAGVLQDLRRLFGRRVEGGLRRLVAEDRRLQFGIDDVGDLDPFGDLRHRESVFRRLLEGRKDLLLV